MKVKKIDTSLFSIRLKEIRTEKFNSMDKFCEMFNKACDCNLSKAAVSRWESGLREPAMSTVILLSEFFCVSVNWLIGLTDTRNEEFSEEDLELIDMLKRLSTRSRIKLLAYAYELEENETRKD